ncbi:MAG: GIY-YIG nuclease family protein [Bacteroidetes bacterium]|nr:GIY-YIG nuclease family protein [Bacteroidota bacterium]
MNHGTVYILTNKLKTVLYVGVTNNLERRMLEHKSGNGCVFTKKYNVKWLLYFQEFDDIEIAIANEKRIKRYKRSWKNNLINSMNPEWKDLAADWFTEEEIKSFGEWAAWWYRL